MRFVDHRCRPCPEYLPLESPRIWISISEDSSVSIHWVIRLPWMFQQAYWNRVEGGDWASAPTACKGGGRSWGSSIPLGETLLVVMDHGWLGGPLPWGVKWQSHNLIKSSVVWFNALARELISTQTQMSLRVSWMSQRSRDGFGTVLPWEDPARPVTRCSPRKHFACAHDPNI